MHARSAPGDRVIAEALEHRTRTGEVSDSEMDPDAVQARLDAPRDGPEGKDLEGGRRDDGTSPSTAATEASTTMAVENPISDSMSLAGSATPRDGPLTPTADPPPTSKPGDQADDQIQIAVQAGPAATPGLQLAVGTESLLRVRGLARSELDKALRRPSSQSYKAELPVTGGSGTQIGVVRVRTKHRAREPWRVQLVAPSGETLMSYEIASPREILRRHGCFGIYTGVPVPVQLSGHVYASCSDAFESPTLRVTRVDGSGGTLVERFVPKGHRVLLKTLSLLGPVLCVCTFAFFPSVCWTGSPGITCFFVVVFLPFIGLILICCHGHPDLDCGTGRVTSLDGTIEYAPHGGRIHGVSTINFAPDPEDEKRDSYQEYDAKTKVDALVAIIMTEVIYVMTRLEQCIPAY